MPVVGHGIRDSELIWERCEWASYHVLQPFVPDAVTRDRRASEGALSAGTKAEAGSGLQDCRLQRYAQPMVVGGPRGSWGSGADHG